MSTLIAVVIAIAGVAGLVGLVALMAWLGNRQAASEAIARHKETEARNAVETERKAAAVVADHRTVGDTVGKLRDGTF